MRRMPRYHFCKLNIELVHAATARCLRRLRRVEDITQTALCTRLGISQPAWSRYESGVVSPTMPVLLELRRAGYSVDSLLDSILEDIYDNVA